MGLGRVVQLLVQFLVAIAEVEDVGPVMEGVTTLVGGQMGEEEDTVLVVEEDLGVVEQPRGLAVALLTVPTTPLFALSGDSVKKLVILRISQKSECATTSVVMRHENRFRHVHFVRWRINSL